jgi:peptidoglycan hydrolase-like protein with peptidoglycan-binding domain
VTWLPPQGAVISVGHQVFGVDGHPVDLFYGPVPLWRTLKAGVSDGPDVLEVERDLATLGFGSGLTVDDHYTSATADAVKAYAADRGWPATIPWQALAGGIAASVVIGGIAGLYPAQRASRVSPAVALATG